MTTRSALTCSPEESWTPVTLVPSLEVRTEDTGVERRMLTPERSHIRTSA